MGSTKWHSGAPVHAHMLTQAECPERRPPDVLGASQPRADARAVVRPCSGGFQNLRSRQFIVRVCQRTLPLRALLPPACVGCLPASGEAAGRTSTAYVLGGRTRPSADLLNCRSRNSPKLARRVESPRAQAQRLAALFAFVPLSSCFVLRAPTQSHGSRVARVARSSAAGPAHVGARVTRHRRSHAPVSSRLEATPPPPRARPLPTADTQPALAAVARGCVCDPRPGGQGPRRCAGRPSRAP